MLCELREEELLVILCMVTLALIGLGAALQCHLTLLLPCSYVYPTTLQGSPPALEAGLSRGPCGLNFGHFGVSQSRVDGASPALLDGICVCLSGIEFE